MRFLLLFFSLAACSSSKAPAPGATDGGPVPVALLRASIDESPRIKPAQLKVRQSQSINLRLAHRGKKTLHHLVLGQPTTGGEWRDLVDFGSLAPGKSLNLNFRAPEGPGRYPIYCRAPDSKPSPCGFLLVE